MDFPRERKKEGGDQHADKVVSGRCGHCPAERRC